MWPTQESKQSNSDPVKRIIFAGILALFGLIPTIVAVSIYFEIDGAVVSQGSLIIEGKPKVVQHLDGGILKKINYTDGDVVEKGDVVLNLDDVLLEANIKIYSSRLREALAKKARLLAERDRQNDVRWDTELLDVLEIGFDQRAQDGQLKLFEARRTTIENQRDQLIEQEAQLANQIEGIKAVATSKSNQMKMVSEELIGLEELLDKGNITLSRVLQLRREYENMTGEHSEQMAEIARIRNAISEKKMQASQLIHQFRESVLTELQEVDQEINDMTQQLYATKEQLKRTAIKAPIGGVIHDSEVHTVGGVIEPGQVVMKIIPQDFEFIVEARIETLHVDDLYKGQPARIRFTSFNQRQTPELFGSVKDVSASTFLDEQTGLNYYIAKIVINDGEIKKLNGKHLISGMQAEVYVTTEQRSIASYLVRPLTDQLQRAMREE